MLSKSAARAFFVGGTVLFSGVFLFLTVDTVMQIPAQTKQQNLSDAVVRGKGIWTDNNCMGCHTLLGEGAYYAPELTKAYDRRGPAWIKIFLKNPEAMFPGERKMVQYHFSDQQIDDVVAFLKWISEMDLNGFPPKPTPMPGVAVASTMAPGAPAAALNAPAMFKTICVSCHSVGGQGGTVGPALDGVGDKFSADYLTKWLTNPQAVKPGTAMPQLPMTGEERAELVQFLSALKKR
jgi:nitric oxide reductase subunit C